MVQCQGVSSECVDVKVNGPCNCSEIGPRWVHVLTGMFAEIQIVYIFSLCKFSIHTRRKWTNHQRQNSLLVALENEDATRRKRQHKPTLVFSLKDLETTPHGWTRYLRKHILLLKKGSKVLRVMTLAEGTQKTSR